MQDRGILADHEDSPAPQPNHAARVIYLPTMGNAALTRGCIWVHPCMHGAHSHGFRCGCSPSPEHRLFKVQRLPSPHCSAQIKGEKAQILSALGKQTASLSVAELPFI